MNRPTLLLSWTVLAVWSACLWVVAGQAFGCSWSAMVEAAAAELAALAVALALPNAVLKVVFTLAMWVRPADTLAVQMLLSGRGRASSARRARGLLRLLGLATAVCAAGGLATTVGTGAASAALGALGRMFLYPTWVWSVVRVGVEVAFFLPLAAGVAGVVLVGSLLCRYGPSDPCRYVMRDLMLSAGVGLAAAAGLWWAGANLLGVCFVCAAAMLGISAATGIRRQPAARAVRFVVAAPADAAAASTARRRRQRGMNLAIFALLGWVLAIQCRALRDASGCGWEVTWLWVAVTGAAGALARRRLDRQVVPGLAIEAVAASAGGALVAATQVALLALAAVGHPGRWLWIALAVGGQLPFAVLSATVLARRRRVFAGFGYPGRFWLADAALGLALGMTLAILMLASRGGAAIAGGTLLLCVTVCFPLGVGLTGQTGRGPRKSTPLGRQLRWAGVGAVAILAVAMTAAGLTRAVRQALGPHVAVGASLTVCQTDGGEVVTLPDRDLAPASPALTAMARALIGSRAGRWWLLSAGDAEVLYPLPEGVRASVFLPDGAFARLPGWRQAEALSPVGRYLNMPGEDLDGVYLASLPAGHADGWCLHNAEVLSGCVGRLGAGGLMVLRVAAGRRRLAELLSVAATFEWATGGGSAAVAASSESLELLLLARPGQADPAAGLDGLVPPAGADVKVISLKSLMAISSPPPRTTMLAPGRRGGSEVSFPDLCRWLRRQP